MKHDFSINALLVAIILMLCCLQSPKPVEAQFFGGGGGGIPSIAGTANQITESGSPGAVTLSLPSQVHIPTAANTSALTVGATNTTGNSSISIGNAGASPGAATPSMMGS